MQTLRVIRDGKLHPHRNMALDEALLCSAGPPTLRIYGWSPPGLSLGYFQATAEFEDVPGDHVLVRRLTGGGAVYHQDEITFALTVDTSLLPADVTMSYEAVHGAVAAALRNIDVEAHMLHTGKPVGSGRAGGRWCFAEPGPMDLVGANGRKLFGSAQRRVQRPRPRVLHHGSLLLAPPPAMPLAGGVTASGVTAGVDVLVTGLVERLAEALGLEPEAGDATAAETALADTLCRDRYATDGFLCRH